MQKQKHTIYLRLCAALLVLCPAYVPAFQLHNSEYNFSVQVPDEFKAFDFLKVHSGRTRQYVKKNTLHGFRIGGTADNPEYTHLLIEKSDLAMTSRFFPVENRSVMENAWQGIDINLYRHEDGFYKGEPTRVTLTAVVPLKEEPIQIKVSGSPQKENQMKVMLESVLGSLQAEAGLHTRMSGYGYFLVPLSILILVVFLYSRRNKV